MKIQSAIYMVTEKEEETTTTPHGPIFAQREQSYHIRMLAFYLQGYMFFLAMNAVEIRVMRPGV